MVPPPRSRSRPRASTVTEEQDTGERRWEPNAGASSTNPYRSPPSQFKRE
jgi:hypothetical protein